MKINSIYDVIGNVDDKFVSEAEAVGRKKRPILLIVAAVAAALSLLVGFTTAVRNHYEINGEPVVDFNIKIHDDYVIPPIEEMIELGAKVINAYDTDSDFMVKNFGIVITDDVTVYSENSNGMSGYEYRIDNVSPSAIIEKYGFKSVINEHFTENVSLEDFPPEIYTQEDFKEAITMMNLYPMHVEVFENCIYTRFWLIDNESGLPLFVINNHYIGELSEPVVINNTDYTDEYEIIDLNDGNKAIIGMNAFITGDDHFSAYAKFTYKGDFYSLSCPVDINGMKRIIANFGFIDQ